MKIHSVVSDLELVYGWTDGWMGLTIMHSLNTHYAKNTTMKIEQKGMLVIYINYNVY
jgi:hypothetical protein